MNEAEVELLTAEYVEEVLAAGGARHMDANSLAEFVSELVLSCFDQSICGSLRPHALEVAQLFLLPEECRKRGIEVDAETVERLRGALR